MTKSGAPVRIRRGPVKVAVLLIVAMVASGCLFYPAAHRHIEASGGSDVPWWC